jgi:hypothetical protein
MTTTLKVLDFRANGRAYIIVVDTFMEFPVEEGMSLVSRKELKELKQDVQDQEFF